MYQKLSPRFWCPLRTPSAPPSTRCFRNTRGQKLYWVVSDDKIRYPLVNVYDGKSLYYTWETSLFQLGHFQWLCQSLPEGNQIFQGINIVSMTLDNVIQTGHDKQTHTCDVLRYLALWYWMHMGACQNCGTRPIIQNGAILAMKPAWASWGIPPFGKLRKIP